MRQQTALRSLFLVGALLHTACGGGDDDDDVTSEPGPAGTYRYNVSVGGTVDSSEVTITYQSRDVILVTWNLPWIKPGPEEGLLLPSGAYQTLAFIQGSTFLVHLLTPVDGGFDCTVSWTRGFNDFVPGTCTLRYIFQR
jgi:hypothetical protein